MIGIEKHGFNVPCDTQNCRNRSKWRVGNLAYSHTCMNLCDECKEKLGEFLGQDMAVVEELKEKLEAAENELVTKNEIIMAAKAESQTTIEPTPIEKEIYDCVKVDGRISKSDLIALGKKHGIKLDESMKVAEMFVKLGEKKSE